MKFLKTLKMFHKSLILLVIALLLIRLADVQGQIVKDIDGNVYPSVSIGNQIWMAENLKTTKFNDGTPILLVTDNKAWKTITTPAYCWLNNDIDNKDVYGALYNWFTVNTKKLCPKGWHIPADTEWSIMITFLGDKTVAGDKLKEAGQVNWKNTLDIGTNDFGFTGIPGGMRLYTGVFPLFANSYAVFWSATQNTNELAWNRGLYYTTSIVYKGSESKHCGFSVRCLKD